MEPLFELTSYLNAMGYSSYPEDALRERLGMYNGDVNSCIDSILTNPPEVGHVDVTAGNVPVPPPVLFRTTLVENFMTNDSIVELDVRTEGPTVARIHPDLVQNGDCLFYCLGLILLRLYHVSASSVYASFPSLSDVVAESLAAQVRTDIFQYIEDHWADISLISRQTWWETMKLAHNVAIPESEKQEHGDEDWGDTADTTLIAWKAKRYDFYGSSVEINAVVEMVWYMDKIPLVIRQWRTEGRQLYKLPSSLMHDIFDANLQSCVIADMLHSGANDTNQAHWQLMNHGSFLYVEEEETEGPTTRRRKIEYDPDWEPEPTKKKSKKKSKKK
jgi:hypothetical protein